MATFGTGMGEYPGMHEKIRGTFRGLNLAPTFLTMPRLIHADII
jgi:hypothetical protein